MDKHYGYQPNGKKLDPNNPPKGGSGLIGNRIITLNQVIVFIKNNYINEITRDLFGDKLDNEISMKWNQFVNEK